MPVSKKTSPKPRPKAATATPAPVAEEATAESKTKAAPKPETKPTQKPAPVAAPVAASDVQPSTAPAVPAPQVEAAAAIVATTKKEVQMNVELPKQASQIASKSVDQAQAAFERASDLAHSNVQIFDAAAGAFKANATELQLKAMEIAQANSNAVFGLLRRILAARRASELFEAQRSFMSEQFLTSVRQINELNLITLRLASETAKPLQQGVLKSFDELRKAASA